MSPKAPSFTRGISFISNQAAGASIGSPGSRSALEQNDSFTRSVASPGERGHHEGVELGMIRGSSQNLGDELLGEQLHSFAPESTTAHGANPTHVGSHGWSASADATGGQSSPGAQVQLQPGMAADYQARRGPAAQPVSFQSLAALASSHASQPGRSTGVTGDEGHVDDGQNSGGGGHVGGEEGMRQAPTASPFSTALQSESDNAAQHQERLAAVSTGRPVAMDNPGTTSDQSGRIWDEPAVSSGNPGVSSDRGVLGRLPSEKKWAYPIPAGNPMFERMRSRSQSQESSSGPTPNEAGGAQPVLAHTDAAAANEDSMQLPHSAYTDRSAESMHCWCVAMPELILHCTATYSASYVINNAS